MYSTVIGNGRTLQEDTVICGYQIPKGIQVVFPTIVTGSMEQYCQNAGEFKPERWMKSADNDAIHPFASLPYGYGARMCLGRRFADLEMQILLAKVSFCVWFELGVKRVAFVEYFVYTHARTNAINIYFWLTVCVVVVFARVHNCFFSPNTRASRQTDATDT